MTRSECETKIAERLKEIKEIYEQYNPDGKYLSLCIIDGCIKFHNRYWKTDEYNGIEEDGEDINAPIDYHKNLREED